MNDPNTENANNPVRRLSEPVICHNPHCGFQTFEPMTRCPHCRRPMWTTGNFRLLMSLLLVLGFVFLLAGGGFGLVAYRTYTGAIKTVKNREEMEIIMWFLSISFSGFGLAIMAAGAWAVIFGKANWRIIKIVLGFMGAMFLIAIFGRTVLYFLLD